MEEKRDPSVDEFEMRSVCFVAGTRLGSESELTLFTLHG